MKDQVIMDDDDLEDKLTEVWGRLREDVFQSVFHEWMERLEWVREHEGGSQLLAPRPAEARDSKDSSSDRLGPARMTDPLPTIGPTRSCRPGTDRSSPSACFQSGERMESTGR
jgi:hypothetical protein